MAWDNTKPTNTEKIRNLGTVIRANWEAIEENDTGVKATSLNQWAVHLVDRSTIGGSNTPTAIADVGILYCRTISGANQLFFENENGAETQLTFATAPSIGANGYTVLPGGVTLQWFTFSLPSGNTTVTYPTALTSAIYNINLTLNASNTGYNDVDAYIVGTPTITQCVVRNSTGVTYTGYFQIIGV